MLIIERKRAEKRKEKRRHLVYYLPAFDWEENRVVGHVYDITSKGMMLLCSGPIEVGTRISFRVLLPPMLSSVESFSVEAECCWSEHDLDPDKYVVGFAFKNVDHSEAVTINAIIARFAFADK